MRIRSLQSRILALFLLLMVVVQVGGFLLVNTVGMTSARKTISEELVSASRVFDRVLDQDTQRLVQGARLVSADYAFKESVATGDRATIGSVLTNHGKRIDASLMMMIDLDQRIVADTQDANGGKPFGFPRLIARAEADGEAAAMVLVRGDLYLLVIVPVLAPLPTAWVAVGYRVDDVLAQDLHRLTRPQVSFVSRQSGGAWKIQASTLSDQERASLLDNLASGRLGAPTADGTEQYSDDGAMSRVLALPARADERVVAVLQEPLASALEPFHRLQRQLIWISILGAAVSILVSVLIARSIARPVHKLVDTARRIAAGDYSTAPPVSGPDELGDLAAAFRSMQDGIASRESRIMDLAYSDTLTGLPNRALYADRLDQALAAAARAAEPVSVLLMDLDHFKYVNDTLGHSIGDLLLRQVAERLQNVLKRRTDTVARLGGDEFAVLLPGASIENAQRVAENLLSALEAPMTLDGHMVDVRASVGIAAYPEHGNERSTLMRHADVAMYAAKRHALGIAIWDDGYDQHSRERLSLMTDLRRAVDNEELRLVYQPKVSLGLVGEHYVEALIRWAHPTRGIVAPVDFIPFAEQTGYIRSITNWVLANAIAQCATWRSDGIPMNVAVNISARDLMDPELPDRFSLLLKRHNCAARWITLEITESAILEDPGHAIRNLEKLHTIGCKLAIDDYGTGYSSLTYMRRLPVDELKIDKSFVIGMANDQSNSVIVRSTIDLAHNMGLAVVAEGVEDEETLERLRSLGCDAVQGYFMSKALGANEIIAWMKGSAWTRTVREVSGLRIVK